MIDDTYSQAHSLLVVDVNGDGKMDLLTGKRYMAHDHDPGAREPLGIYVSTAARGSADVMPTPGLCRVGVAEQRRLRRIPDFRSAVCRHNHRLSRKASMGSGGLNRSGVSPDGVACASARSFSRMSACR